MAKEERPEITTDNDLAFSSAMPLLVQAIQNLSLLHRRFSFSWSTRYQAKGSTVESGRLPKIKSQKNQTQIIRSNHRLMGSRPLILSYQIINSPKFIRLTLTCMRIILIFLFTFSIFQYRSKRVWTSYNTPSGLYLDIRNSIR